VAAAVRSQSSAARWQSVDSERFDDVRAAGVGRCHDGKDGDYDVKFSDFGSTVSIATPTGSNVVEAPAALYGGK
jgi:hypothetical protein